DGSETVDAYGYKVFRMDTDSLKAFSAFDAPNALRWIHATQQARLLEAANNMDAPAKQEYCKILRCWGFSPNRSVQEEHLTEPLEKLKEKDARYGLVPHDKDVNNPHLKEKAF